ncbi:TLC domain-containing protein [Cokeromyces recurvatus]|uniref:TLC domain-containing protein n=1 Tax=Cokeromyces recurvatus TaxID=90255 RepID=UPI00221FB6E0|nr:TLC domain-containing protein [Cokeromyces recurvatus]KAI7898301.1 TLC domain-containing protein [Cokeromyces recurvatus]
MNKSDLIINITKPSQSSKLTRIKKFILQYEAEIFGSIILTVLVNYILGNLFARKCLLISYQKTPDTYDKGIDDIYFVAFWAIAFTFLRAFFIKYFYLPLSKYFNIGESCKRQRVAEQGYILIYYLVFGTAGLYIMYHSPYWFNTAHLWIGYPHMINKEMKYYYLMQLAFWFQQIYGLHIEKRRKDHYAMLSHHIVTIVLVGASYYCNATRVGNAILCCMDLSDIFLSLAKILKYLGFTNVCNIAFGLFALSWPITRHIFFSCVIWSIVVEPSKYLDLQWDPSNGKYLTLKNIRLFLILLLILNVIMFYWFLMIVKLIIKVIKGTAANDPRSDDEDEEDSNCSDNGFQNPIKICSEKKHLYN